MVGPNNGWLGLLIRSAIAACGVTIVAMGCASPQAPSRTEYSEWTWRWTKLSMVSAIGLLGCAANGFKERIERICNGKIRFFAILQERIVAKYWFNPIIRCVGSSCCSSLIVLTVQT